MRRFPVLLLLLLGIGCSPTPPTVAPLPPPPPTTAPIPDPADAVTLSLQAAYDKDGGSAVLKLADVMRQASMQAATATKAADFVATVHASTVAAIGTQLPATRAAIGLYLNSVLPTDPSAVYTDADRTKVKDTYAKIAASLAKVK